MDIQTLREKIDMIDAQLVSLFVQRMEVSAAIADYKKARGLPVHVPAREEEKLLEVSRLAGPEMEAYTRQLYLQIFSLSRHCQTERNAADEVRP